MIRSARRNKVALIYSVLVTSIHVVVASTHGGPVAVPDVPAYLSIAQWVWGGVLPENLAFHPGYGFLVSPFGALSGDQLHYAALLLNAVLAGWAVFLAMRLIDQIGGSQRIKWAIAVIATIQPGLAASSRIAWPETLLVVAILTITHLILKNSEWSWRLASLVGMLLISVHPRAVVIVIAVAIVALLQGNKRAFLCGAIPGALLTSVALSVTQTWPKARVSQSRGFDNYLDLAGSTLGQILCLAAGTISLGYIGLALGLKDSTGAKKLEPERIARCFVALSALGMILLGGWALAGSNRADTLLYSRYIDPWSVPLVIFAITALEKKEVTRRVYVLGVMLVTCSLVTVLYLATEATITGRRIMTLPLGFLWRVSGDRLEIVACLAAAIVFCGLVTSKFSWYVPAVILTILAGISVILNNQHLAEVGRVSKGQSTVTEMIPMSEKCISYDTETIKPYAIWLYRLQLPNLEHNAVELSSVESLCGDYVIADREALIDCTTAELIKKEPRAKWGLWIYPNRGCP